MTDEQFVKNLGKFYNIVLSLRKDDEYEVEQEQMDKLCKLYKFFFEAANGEGDEVSPLSLVPREEHGGVTATFLVFDVYGQRVQDFCHVLSACSAVSIEARTDGRIEISCTVPNVFKKKLN